jgi:hypothetical protein
MRARSFVPIAALMLARNAAAEAPPTSSVEIGGGFVIASETSSAESGAHLGGAVAVTRWENRLGLAVEAGGHGWDGGHNKWVGVDARIALLEGRKACPQRRFWYYADPSASAPRVRSRSRGNDSFGGTRDSFASARDSFGGTRDSFGGTRDSFGGTRGAIGDGARGAIGDGARGAIGDSARAGGWPDGMAPMPNPPPSASRCTLLGRLWFELGAAREFWRADETVGGNVVRNRYSIGGGADLGTTRLFDSIYFRVHRAKALPMPDRFSIVDAPYETSLVFGMSLMFGR